MLQVFALFFSYTFKMELLKFSSMARRLTSHGSGKQVWMCVLHFTCIPTGIFIQLRQQLGMYFLEDAGRQIGWEKWLLSSGRGFGGESPNQEPPSLGASPLVGTAFVTHIAQAFSPSWKLNRREHNLPVEDFLFCVQVYSRLSSHLTALLGTKWPVLSHSHLYCGRRFSDFLQEDHCLLRYVDATLKLRSLCNLGKGVPGAFLIVGIGCCCLPLSSFFCKKPLPLVHWGNQIPVTPWDHGNHHILIWCLQCWGNK